MVDIKNIIEVKNNLDLLKEDTKPYFGELTPQQMVEHLEYVIFSSIGKISVELAVDPKHLDSFLEFLKSDKEIKPGFKAKAITPETLVLRNINLSAAKISLLKSIGHFFNYYEIHPEAKYLHPTFGMLDFTLWHKFHNKHFTHHFKQFGLVPSDYQKEAQQNENSRKDS